MVMPEAEGERGARLLEQDGVDLGLVLLTDALEAEQRAVPLLADAEVPDTEAEVGDPCERWHTIKCRRAGDRMETGGDPTSATVVGGVHGHRPDTAEWVAEPVGRTDQLENDRVAEGASSTTSPDPADRLSDEERADRLGQLQGLIELMRPSVQADGGDLVLVSADVETGVVEVQLQGACSSCAISSATLQGGVERILTDRLPWVREVVGGLDESMDPFESASLGQGGYVPGY